MRWHAPSSAAISARSKLMIEAQHTSKAKRLINPLKETGGIMFSNGACCKLYTLCHLKINTVFKTRAQFSSLGNETTL